MDMERVSMCYRRRVAHWHYHSAILRSTASLHSSSPGLPHSSLLYFFSSGFQVLQPTKQISFCYFAFSCWLLSHPIETSLHHAPWSMNRSSTLLALHLHRCPHCPSAASPPLSFLHGYLFLSPVVIGSSGSSHFTCSGSVHLN